MTWNDGINAVSLKRGMEKTSKKCRKMREIIRLLKLKITKKSIHCKGNRWHSTGEPKETRIWACVPVIAA